MRPSGGSLMKVLRIKRIMDMGSHSSRSGLRVREPPGPQFPPLPATPSYTGRGDRGQKILYFHVLSWTVGGSAAWVAGSDGERKSPHSTAFSGSALSLSRLS